VAKKSAEAKRPVFEECLKELEKIVSKLESGNLGLAESLDQYEQGVGHLKNCYKLLDRAEKRIEIVSGVDPAGQARTESFVVDDAESLTAKGSARSSLRSQTANRPNKGEVDDESSLF